MNDGLMHYGTPRHSGRYPWGSGDTPEQRNKSFLGYVDKLKKEGMSETDIAKGMGMSTTELRQKRSIAKDEVRKDNVAQALRLKDKGYSNVEIGKQMGINESSVRSLLNLSINERSNMTTNTANMLKSTIDEKGYIDVGVGVERYIGVSRTKLKSSISQLEEEGYLVTYIPVEQLGTGKKTSVMVLSKPKTEQELEFTKLKNSGLDNKEIAKKLGLDVDSVTKLEKGIYSEVYKNKDNIKSITDHTDDGGRTFLGLEPVKSISSNRILIKYDEEGGSDKDGVIELRRGVDDLSLGKSRYAQVRVGVDDSHYLKGMAMYTDDIPDGYDVIYNTNKPKGTPPEKVFKEMKRNGLTGEVDQDNPFGAVIKAGGQHHYLDDKGSSQLSAINIVNEEGDWSKWSKTISSQVLSKQTPALAKKQLDLAFASKKAEFDEIMSLTNPAVKKKLLESFSDDCDSSAVHLKAAALPRQGSHVILPFTSIKDNEIYAPNYKNGERVVLVRYPHGGIFEIPELIVNNRNPVAKNTIGQAKDAVGINARVAERLSGADFDGDTVLVIPNDNKSIKNSAPLKGLMNFDPKISYKGYDGMPVISSRTKQMKMGEVSNLITDMTIKGATPTELAAAVRHSMVVIDSEKHKLNYKQSFIDNNIAALKKRYQGGERGGASTLISKASSETRVGIRKESIDATTGKKVYDYTNETYIKTTKLKDGTIKKTEMLRTVSSTKMAEADDAFKLSSGTKMETVYATHANKLKALANESRKETFNSNYVSSPSAKKAYSNEVNTLNAKLNVALKNAPLERQAQVIANSIVNTKKQANPDMTHEELKKIKSQALAEARSRTGAGKQRIDISTKEWEAIQAGAVTNNTLNQIINNTDLDKVKILATPRTLNGISTSQEARIKSMLSAGRTQSEIASALGISTSMINKVIN